MSEPLTAALLSIGHWRRPEGEGGAARSDSLRHIGQTYISLRSMPGETDGESDSPESEEGLQVLLSGPLGSFVVEPLPNVKYIFYGYGVEYTVERLEVTDHPIALPTINRSAG